MPRFIKIEIPDGPIDPDCDDYKIAAFFQAVVNALHRNGHKNKKDIPSQVVGAIEAYQEESRELCDEILKPGVSNPKEQAQDKINLSHEIVDVAVTCFLLYRNSLSLVLLKNSARWIRPKPPKRAL